MPSYARLAFVMNIVQLLQRRGFIVDGGTAGSRNSTRVGNRIASRTPQLVLWLLSSTQLGCLTGLAALLCTCPRILEELQSARRKE